MNSSAERPVSISSSSHWLRSDVPLDITLSLQSYLLSDFPSLPSVSDLDRASASVAEYLVPSIRQTNTQTSKQRSSRATREAGSYGGTCRGPSITREGRKATKRGRGSWSVFPGENREDVASFYWLPQHCVLRCVSVMIPICH